MLSHEGVVVDEVGHGALPEHVSANADVGNDKLVVLIHALVLTAGLEGATESTIDAVAMHPPHVLDALFNIGRASGLGHERGQDGDEGDVLGLEFEES